MVKSVLCFKKKQTFGDLNRIRATPLVSLEKKKPHSELISRR